jgi:N-methylhydantoinase B
VATATLREGHLTIDFTGTSGVSARGINSPKCYSDAYVGYGVKCVVAPDIPNNAGSLSAVEVTAPPHTIVNPLPPSAVTARHVVGQMLPDLVFGCLAGAVNGQVPAEGAGSIWVLAMNGGGRAQPFNVMSIGIGGGGARPGKDGLSCTAFPSGVGTIPIEVTEAAAPLLFRRREIAPGSAGAGRYRGGYAPVIEIEHRRHEDFRFSAATFDRRRNPARGRSGGADGRVGSCRLSGGAVLEGKGVYVVPAGQTLCIEAPGGGGFGDPRERDPAALAADLRDGLLTPDDVMRQYGVTPPPY